MSRTSAASSGRGRAQRRWLRRRGWVCSRSDNPNGPFRSDGPGERCGAIGDLLIVAVVQNGNTQVTLWARGFARLYDPFLWFGEHAGLSAQRKQLLGRARGRTVE